MFPFGQWQFSTACAGALSCVLLCAAKMVNVEEKQTLVAAGGASETWI